MRWGMVSANINFLVLSLFNEGLGRLFWVALFFFMTHPSLSCCLGFYQLCLFFGCRASLRQGKKSAFRPDELDAGNNGLCLAG